MLSTQRLKLRAFTADDLNLLHQLHANREVAKTTIDGVQSLETVKKHLDNFIAHQEKFGFSQWAVFEKDSGKFVGRGGFTKRALSEEVGEYVEIRFAFLPEFWGQGYASEITRELIKFAFENLGLEVISAAHGVSNDKSKQILTKNGFTLVKIISLPGSAAESATKFYLLHK